MKVLDLLNLKVEHKTLGEGTIIEVVNNYLTIQFPSKKSRFNYPEAFEKFLVIKDELVRADILKEIEIKKQAEEQQHMANVALKAEDKYCNSDSKDISYTRKRKPIENGFGPDYNVKYLTKQPIFTYQQVEKQFEIKITGFGRGINRTPSSVVLISSIDKKKTGFVYHDHWTTDGDYIYSGEGKNGDQKLTLGNKAIIDAQRDGKIIYLFVKFSSQEYYYQGIFSLVNYTYEDEKDELGNTRKEYKFRLKKQFIEN